MPKGTIRSAAHRQILAWLRQGPSTVSEIAEQFEMRMPHASLACRQLRASGLVVRDESGGLRNAPMYLSQSGLDRIRENAVAKLRQHARRIDRKSVACVLQADASDVLIGYVEPLRSPLLFIPASNELNPTSSTGNEGGVWVLLEEEETEWYNLDDFSLALPPSAAQGTTLQDFGQRPNIVGLAHGRVFEYTASARLVDGQVFSVHDPSPRVPLLRLNHGDLPLGAVLGSDRPYFPPPGLLGHLPAALDRALVLEALGDGAVQLTDRFANRRRRLPITVIDAWLGLRHPRMSSEKRSAMAAELKDQLADDPQTVATALGRDLLLDFGNVVWVETDWGPEVVDIYGMSPRGVEAVLLDVFSSSGLPVCVDWPFPEDASETAHLQHHPSCRVWLVRRGESLVDGDGRPVLRPTSKLSVIHVQLARYTLLPLQLKAGRTPLASETTPQDVPADANALLQHHNAGKHLRMETVPEGAVGRRLKKAHALYPDGDEELANRWEGEDPLAAWIASEPQHRGPRFLRIHQRLPHGWVDLISVEDTPLSLMALAVEKASESWRHRAFQRLRHEVEHTPTCVVDFLAGLQHPSSATWYATCLLTMLDPRQVDHQEPLAEALDVWRRSPQCIISVLNHLFTHLDGRSEDGQVWIERLVAVASEQSRGDVFRTWAYAVETVRSGMPWMPEQQRRCMEVFPESWWGCYASEWLLTQLASVSGRAWLREHPVCWLAQLYTPAGLPSGIPGFPVAQGAPRLTSDQLIGVKMLGNGDGVAPLDEVYEALYAAEHDLPPPVLDGHPHAAWLVRPVATWPPFDASVLEVGDSRIGALLFAVQFAWRTRG